MKTANEKAITVSTNVKKPINEVWEYWTQPNHVIQWNHASEDWHTPRADNDLRLGGKFNYRMEAKDGSLGFDFEGVYNEVVEKQKIAYAMSDGRKVEITFEEIENKTHMTETFDPDRNASLELQKQGWQSILDNFKKYAENQGK